jgi:hypothetical protein
MDIREETEFRLHKLQITQERLEREILDIANCNCLPPEEARRKIDEMEKGGQKTLVFCGIKCLSVRDGDGNEQPFIPPWYPLYASIGGFFNPPVDKPLFEAVKRVRWQNLPLWYAMQGDENEDGYAQARAAVDTVNKNLEQYRRNERDIEDLERLLEEMEVNSETGTGTNTDLLLIFSEYPDFRNDYQLLIKSEYVYKPNDGNISWIKSKQSLAEYFRGITGKGSNTKWVIIEKLFKVKNLKESLKAAYHKPSKDYEKWLEIKKSFPA